MNSLIINTSNKVLEIVLEKNGKLYTSTSAQNAKHNEILIPMLSKLLEENKVQLKDIDRLGVVIGPGSFTGIRVGIATVKAFRDALNIDTKGINNLDYLYKLAENQYKDFGAVAISGSADSYFVAKKINDIIYKFDRNLTRDELASYAEGKPIAMFEHDDSINSVVVKLDEKVLLDCLIESKDTSLTPVYYQLSQAEREKLNRVNKTIRQATIDDAESIANLESEIAVNSISLTQIKQILLDKTYTSYVIEVENEIVGMIILQITDEINIVGLSVKKQYRNMGIATMLIQKAEQLCKDNNILNISLEVKYDNIPAYLLYTKHGFKLRRRRKAYYDDGMDCLELVKQI